MRTLEEAMSEVSRELNVRRRCYTRWIADGKLDSIEAKDRLERLEAAHTYLDRFKEDLRVKADFDAVAKAAFKELDSTVQG